MFDGFEEDFKETSSLSSIVETKVEEFFTKSSKKKPLKKKKNKGDMDFTKAVIKTGQAYLEKKKTDGFRPASYIIRTTVEETA